MRVRTILAQAVLSAAVVAATCVPAGAITFSNSYTDGGTWRTIYAQGFKPSVSPSPNPGLAATDTVHLDRFQFFKSGTADAAANIQLAIINNYFMNLATLTTNSPELIGLSTNTIASTAGIATGAPITFNFNHLPLTYGADTDDDLTNNNYVAVFVNNNAGTLTPVQVSALGVDYLEGQNEIESDYGPPGDYFLATSNYINTNEFGMFFATFSQTASGGYGDSNFVATYDLPAGVSGDYNGNGVVDAADYVLWRNGGPLQNEIATAGSVTLEDYTEWRARFGNVAGSGAGLGVAAIPEPAATSVVALLAAGTLLRRKRSAAVR
ncbi:MAG: hypothetical protein U0805_07405 [Pirellulales bacterium]